jgi:hypothetical protein
MSNFGGGTFYKAVEIKTTDYTLTTADNKKLVPCYGSFIVTLDTALPVGFTCAVLAMTGTVTFITNLYTDKINNVDYSSGGDPVVLTKTSITSGLKIIVQRMSDGWLIYRDVEDAALAVSINVGTGAIRGLFGGGNTGSYSNVIDYVTIASTGNATDFGDLTVARDRLAACSSSTRGLFGGGYISSIASNVIDYITISTAGNATDFGDLTVARYGLAACSSSTRGLFGGGSVIDYVTIASTGNATDFGDLTVARQYLAACSSSTRGLFGGGSTGSYSNVIDYVTISTAGNATDFGDLTVARDRLAACSSSTRGLFGGPTNAIDYVTIASTGIATDFGDLTVARNGLAACSNGHGGLA